MSNFFNNSQNNLFNVQGNGTINGTGSFSMSHPAPNTSNHQQAPRSNGQNTHNIQGTGTISGTGSIRINQQVRQKELELPPWTYPEPDLSSRIIHNDGNQPDLNWHHEQFQCKKRYQHCCAKYKASDKDCPKCKCHCHNRSSNTRNNCHSVIERVY